MSRIATCALIAAALVVIIGFGATWFDLFSTLSPRPLDYSEAEVLFDAGRQRAHLPLYFDVVLGASYGNDVPSRHFVVYVPTHAWLLSHFPTSVMNVGGRLLSSFAWLGALAWTVARGRVGRSPASLLCAAFVAGTWGLSVYASYARPDAMALLAVGLAFSETMRRRRVGFLGGALFALGFWIKPNCIGLFGGSMLAEFRLHRARALRAVLGAAATTVIIVVWLQLVSQGQWLPHLIASAVQPFSASLWSSALEHYLPFYAFPVGFALWCAWRNEGAGYGVIALTTSALWTFLTVGKIGAAGNYWMEPCLGAVAVLANTPIPALSPRARAALSAGALVQAIYVGVADVQTAFQEARSMPARAAFLKRIGDRCGSPNGLVVSNVTGTEMQLNGRIIFSAMQIKELVERGRFPVRAWLDTVASDSIRCVVIHTSPPAGEKPLAETDAFPAEVTAALAKRFAFADAAEDMMLYVRTQ